MTIREFADKYGIPYHIVYEATYKVSAISTMRRDREYPEDKLFDATDELIQTRVEKHKRLMSQAHRMFINLHSTKEMEVVAREMPKVRR